MVEKMGSRFLRRGPWGDQVEKKQPGIKKKARNKNGRKRAEKIFALLVSITNYYIYRRNKRNG